MKRGFMKYSMLASERVLRKDKKALVYWNSHKKCFSVKYSGEKVWHADTLYMTECTFKVREEGRKKVIRTKRKNVHAFVKGYVHLSPPKPLQITTEQIKYNPHEHEAFMLERKGNLHRIRYIAYLQCSSGKLFCAYPV